jgi:hypothetical protein
LSYIEFCNFAGPLREFAAALELEFRAGGLLGWSSVDLPFFAVVVASIFAIVGWPHLKTRRFARAMRGVAQKHGLQAKAGGLFRSPKAEGEFDGFGVVVDSYNQTSGEASRIATRIRVQTELPKSITVKCETRLSRLSKALIGEDVQVGIARFDDDYLLRANDDHDLLTRMGATSREAVEVAIGQDGAALSDGVIVWIKPGYRKDVDELSRVLADLLAMARSLTDHCGLDQEALLRHAFTEADPSVGFRRRCLEALMGRFPGDERTGSALALAARSDEPALRFIAARLEGQSGLSVIGELARDPRLPDDLRLEAKALLGTQLSGGLALADGSDTGVLAIAEEEEAGALAVADDPSQAS